MVKAMILQFRRGRTTFTPRHFLIEIEGVDSKEKTKDFIGKNVSWVSEGKKPVVINGVIKSAHGNKGVVRAIFEKGLPGQSIGMEVKIN